MRFCYADPPYFGRCSYYGHNHGDRLRPFDRRCWDDLETHRLLIEYLVENYPDGWALSASAPSLRMLLPFAPLDVRVAPWVKTFCAFKRGIRPAYAWEPVLFVSRANPPHLAHPPPYQGRTADHAEGLLRRPHHAAEGSHRREAARLLPLGARAPQCQARGRDRGPVPRRRQHAPRDRRSRRGVDLLA